MAVVLANLKADCGEVYDNLNNGTTAAAALLTKANTNVANITGTTVGYESSIRPLADVYICNQLLGSSSASDLGIGPIRVGRTDVNSMMNNFMKEVKSELARDGFTLNVANLLFEAVNQ